MSRKNKTPRSRKLHVESLEDRNLLATLIIPNVLTTSGISGFFSYGWKDGESVDYSVKYSNGTTDSAGSDTAADYHGYSQESHSFSQAKSLGAVTITAQGEYGDIATAQATLVTTHSGTFSALGVIGPNLLIKGQVQYVYTQGWFAKEKVTYQLTLPGGKVSSGYSYAYANGLVRQLFNISSKTPEGTATLVFSGQKSKFTLTKQLPVQKLPCTGQPTLSVPQYVIPGGELDATGTCWTGWAYLYVKQVSNTWYEGQDLPDSHGRMERTMSLDDKLVPWQPLVVEGRDSSGQVLATARTMVVGFVPQFSPYFSGIIASVPVLDAAAVHDISATQLLTQSPQNGVIEKQSLAERTIRGLNGSETITRTGLTYYDKDRGVDIYAPSGQYFVEYSNGAVELRTIPPNLPPGQAHPLVHEIGGACRNAPNLGQVVKPVARTGLTFFDPARGIDVQATAGKFLIEYMDGKIEERTLPAGGFVPRPEDFTVGGTDNSKPKSAFGPTLQELGLATSSGPKPSSQLYLIGREYTATNGALRVAHDGNVFLQDPVTGIILERSATEGSKAMPKPATTERVLHSENTIKDLFQQAYGRAPNPFELEYWMNRTDKSGVVLLGAMQHAFTQGVTVSLLPKAVSPKAADDIFAQFDGQTITQFNPKAWTWDWVVDGVERRVENFTEWLSTQKDAFKLYYDRTFSFYPPAPVSQKGLDFYKNNPDYVVSPDMQPAWLVNFFHPGGEKSLRIRRVGSASGTQVVLDENGNIILPGEPGAGTPDFCSPTNAILAMCHVGADVIGPWISKTTNTLSSLLP